MRTIRFWSTARLEPERESAEADALALLEAVQIKRCELLQGSVFCAGPCCFLRGVCDGLFVADGVCSVRPDGGDDG
jgi:hypothetical protein